MERDPLRFVWRTAPVLHVGALMLLALALPLTWIGLDLVRNTIDDAIGGRAFANGASAAPFLRYALPLPERITHEPLVLFSGISLERESFVLATIGGLVAVALAIPLIALAFGLARATIGARAIASLRRKVIQGIAAARPSARDEIRRAGALAGEGFAGESGFLGGAVLVPVASGAVLGLAVLYALTVDWRQGGAMAAALAVIGLVWPRRLDALRRAGDAHRAEGAALQRALSELGRRQPALRAHGTAAFERARLQAELALRDGAVRSVERQAGFAAGATAIAALLAPAILLGGGAWLAGNGGTTAGAVMATLAAALAGMVALDRLARWSRALRETEPLFDEIARTIGALRSHRWSGTAGGAPTSGVLAAEGVSAYDPASGTRISGIDLSIVFPAHVALAGEDGSGARVFAALVGGQLDPAAGRLTFGGVEIAAMEPAERARRIAFAGGETILLSGSLRQNFLYGCPDPDAPDIDQRLANAATAAGLDRLVHARGLSGTIDPAREPRLAAALVDARRAVRATLAVENLADFVDPFDPAHYNRHATIGENILFGRPIGETFREAHLPSHPFVRAILEAEELTKPLARIGLSIAAGMVEIFSDIPDGHPLFERFSFFSASERGYFEDLLERRNERRRGPEPARDRERLIGLAFRYVESRHRLGLLDTETEVRILAARASFAKLLPASLQPAIEFYDPDRVCAAASLQDNLLFGRLAHDRAGAESAVTPVIRRVLKQRGLDQEVFRVGLTTWVDPRGLGLSAREIAAIDLVRCLVRRPDVVVVEHADALADGTAETFITRLRRALVGRGLVVVLPNLPPGLDQPPFDGIVRFERGAVASMDDRRRRQTAAPEPVPA